MVAYLDSSAIAKLVVREPGSDALRRRLEVFDRPVTSTLSAVEVTRAAARRAERVLGRASEVLTGIRMLQMDEGIVRAAGRLSPASLRSLDAIHIASALAFDDDLTCLITYDCRMAEAAEWHDIVVETPT